VFGHLPLIAYVSYVFTYRFMVNKDLYRTDKKNCYGYVTITFPSLPCFIIQIPVIGQIDGLTS